MNTLKNDDLRTVSTEHFSVSHGESFPMTGLKLHCHEAAEFFRVSPFQPEGGVVFYSENEQFTLAAGEAILIPPQTEHRVESRGRCSYDMIHLKMEIFSGHGYRRFTLPFILDIGTHILKLCRDGDWQEDVLNILDNLWEYWENPNVEDWKLEFKGYIFVLWSRIYNNYFANTTAIQVYQKLYNKMYGALEYIHENYTTRIVVSELAKQVNLSVGTFCRYFKRLFGITAITYLNRYRIKKILKMLANSNDKIYDIALKCGFNNLSNFNREFQQYMKCTPSAYRRYSGNGDR